jgi:hypothetical protein
MTASLAAATFFNFELNFFFSFSLKKKNADGSWAIAHWPPLHISLCVCVFQAKGIGLFRGMLSDAVITIHYTKGERKKEKKKQKKNISLPHFPVRKKRKKEKLR